MATNFPTSLDNFTNPLGSDPTNSVTVPHAAQHANANDAIEALEAKVGVNSSAVATSLDYKVTQAQTDITTLQTNSVSKLLYDAKGDILVASAADTPAKLTAGANGLVLTTDSAEATGLKWSAATPLTTKGDLLTHSGSAVVREAVGSNGQMLMADSGATNGIRYVDPPANRNLLINGGMDIYGRNNNPTFAFATSGTRTYSIDRWSNTWNSSMGSWATTRSTTVPTGQGFGYSLKMDCTATTTSAGGRMMIVQAIEGQNVQHVRKGTASAKQLTLSFWAYTTRTGGGTMIAELEDYTNSRFVSAAVTISAASTWEYKTVTFPADTTGTLANSNAAALGLNLWINAGSTYSGGASLQTTWGTTTNTRAVGCTNFADNTANDVHVTGVQLEVGPVATPYEFEPTSTTLTKCERYYTRINSSGAGYFRFGIGQCWTTTRAVAVVHFPTTMRTNPGAPSISTAADFAVTSAAAAAIACTTVGDSGTTTNAGAIDIIVASGLVAGDATQFLANATANAFLAWSAEL